MEEKPKNKERVTEWSFSFAELGEKIDGFVRSLGKSGEEEIKTDTFDEPIGGASSARVRIDLPVCETVVHRTAHDGTLIEGELTHIGDIKFVVSGDSEKSVSLSQTTEPGDWMRGLFGWLGSAGKLHWDIGLTDEIPLTLEVHNGVGKSTFDLRDLLLTDLSIHGGTGEIEVYLPATPQPLPAEVYGGVGRFSVRVPANASVNLDVRAGTGEINLDFAEGTAANVTVKGGVGQTNVRVPTGAAVRVEATMGLGDVSVPSSYQRISGGNGGGMGKSGIWQTPDYDTAPTKIALKLDGGVGGLRVR
jgi:hypothetical protein